MSRGEREREREKEKREREREEREKGLMKYARQLFIPRLQKKMVKN